MKILYVINSLEAGGAEKLVSETLPIMNSNQDIEVDVLLLTDRIDLFGRDLEEMGIKIEYVPLNRLYSLMNIYYLRKYIIRKEYDIVHAHLFPAIYWTSIVSKLMFKNVPKLIMTEHSTHNKRREKNI